MGKKKKFIDKKRSATFQLISRDSSDPNYSEGPSGDRVFFRVDGNVDKTFFAEHNGELDADDESNGRFDDAHDDYSGEEVDGSGWSFEKQTTAGRPGGGSSLPDHVRREILELGFPDDGYNYLTHLREIRNSGGGSSFYQNPKAKLLHQLHLDVKAYDASRIEVSKGKDNDSYENSIYGVATRTVPVTIQKAIDPEVAALLDDSDASRFGSDVDDLEEDFVFHANLPQESEDLEIDKKLSLAEESNVNRKEEEYNGYYLKDYVVDSSGMNEARNHNLVESRTLVGAEPRVRRPLDEQFDLVTISLSNYFIC